VSPIRHRKRNVPERERGGTKHLLLPRFCPLQRFASHGEPLNPARSQLIRLGCALRVSHPLDALLPPWPAELISSRFRSWGSPFEAFLPPLVPYALSSAASLVELRRVTSYPAPPSGLGTPARVPHAGLGFSQTTRQMPPWAFSPLRLLVLDSGRNKEETTIPSHAFSLQPQADRNAGVPGFRPPKTQPVSLETNIAPLGFFTSFVLSNLKAQPQRWSTLTSPHHVTAD